MTVDERPREGQPAPPVDSGSRYDRLIQPDKVHGSLYTDPASSPKSWTRSGIAVGFSSATKARLRSRTITSARSLDRRMSS